jgi:hypothetical protein
MKPETSKWRHDVAKKAHGMSSALLNMLWTNIFTPSGVLVFISTNLPRSSLTDPSSDPVVEYHGD